MIVRICIPLMLLIFVAPADVSIRENESDDFLVIFDWTLLKRDGNKPDTF